MRDKRAHILGMGFVIFLLLPFIMAQWVGNKVAGDFQSSGVVPMSGDLDTGGNDIKMGAGLIGYDGTAAKGLSFDSGNEKVILESGQFVSPSGTAAAPPIDWTTNGFYLKGADNPALACGGVEAWHWTLSNFKSGNAAGPRLLNVAATATQVTMAPNQADGNTGLGGTTDLLSLVAGGVQMMGLREITGASHIIIKQPTAFLGNQFIENFLWGANYTVVWDVTNVVGLGTNVIKTPAGQGGVTLLTTGGATGDYECTQGQGAYFSRAINPMLDAHLRLMTDLAGKEIKVGLSDNPMVEDGKYCIFLFDYSNDNVNWFHSSSDAVDASLAVGPTAGTAQNLRMHLSTAGVAYFYVDEVLVATVTGAVSDGTAMYMFYGIETEANQVEILECDFIQAAWGFD